MEEKTDMGVLLVEDEKEEKIEKWMGEEEK